MVGRTGEKEGSSLGAIEIDGSTVGVSVGSVVGRYVDVGSKVNVGY